MTLQCFALQAIPDNADLARMAISSLVPNGGGLVEPTDFTVTQTGTPSMTVNVSNGRAWIDGTNIAHNTGRAYGNQGQYFVIEDSTYPVALATSDPANPRIDVIYVGVQDAYYTGSNNQPVINVSTGIPTSGATYPANATAIPANAIAVAWIYVAANASTIVNSNITSILGQLVGPRTSDGWTYPALASGWSAYVGGGSYPAGVQFRLLPGGMCTVNGMVKSGAAGSTIVNIPLQFAPITTFFETGQNNSGTAVVQFSANTNIITYYSGAGSPTFLNFQATYSVI